jgi:endonuclease/exonuclease/phosphatase family metal-dependent hydrolase
VTADYVDAWVATNPSDPGFTNPSDEPDQRIDYVYARGATPVSCELILVDPVNGLRASDHLGVVCDFAIPSGGG